MDRNLINLGRLVNILSPSCSTYKLYPLVHLAAVELHSTVPQLQKGLFKVIISQLIRSELTDLIMVAQIW